MQFYNNSQGQTEKNLKEPTGNGCKALIPGGAAALRQTLVGWRSGVNKSPFIFHYQHPISGPMGLFPSCTQNIDDCERSSGRVEQGPASFLAEEWECNLEINWPFETFLPVIAHNPVQMLKIRAPLSPSEPWPPIVTVGFTGINSGVH